MYSLFSTQSSEAGYRLQYVEVFNWGTFDKEIFRINPECNTTLLTGANRSGKTTFIEALLTLLVPEKRMRFYNLASGQKNERNEESYVLGEYGDAENETGKVTLRLREEKSSTYSIILASFKNEDKVVTLIQARWFSGSEMKRSYLVAYKPITIKEDILPFDANGNWKKRLKKRYPKTYTKEIVLDFDGPTKYADAVKKIFGMKEKALTLFSQMIGLKVLGNLDDFIRKNMLEESSVEEHFQNLRGHFQKLLDAHRDIQKDEAKMELLKPVRAKADELNKVKEELLKLDNLKEIRPIFFAKHKHDFLKIEIESCSEELKRVSAKLGDKQTELANDRETEKELDSAIRNDETGQQIQQLDKEIRGKEKEKEKREAKLEKYNKAAVEISLSENPNENLFVEQIQKAKNKLTEIDKELNDNETGLKVKWSDLRNENRQLKDEYDEKAKDLEALIKQKNNIPRRVLEIRQEILEYTGANEKQIPFIGELIQVLERNWEASIEKVLHNFALRLIVPDKYYKQVNEYVNDNDIRGRIIYHRYRKENFLNEFIPDVENSIYSKIEINRDSEYSDWIENQIKRNYDYVCTDKINLHSFSKAVTQQGLIKNDSRHEKDDRPHVLTKDNYVLGWDTKEKIKLTKEALKDLDKQIKDSSEELRKLEKRQERLERESRNIATFLTYELHSEINWKEISTVIRDLQDKKTLLEQSSNRIKELKKQHEAIIKKIEQDEKGKNELSKQEWTLEATVKTLGEKLEKCNKILDPHKEFDLSAKYEELNSKFKKELVDLAFETIDYKEEIILKAIATEIETHNKSKTLLGTQLLTLMIRFKRPDESIMQKFPDWSSSTFRLTEDINYVDEYLEILTRIEKHELIEHKNRFKKYLNEDMITQMTSFSTLLEAQEENIRDSIEDLNKSLRKIKFRNNPHTFIKLYANPHNPKSIHDFKIMLKSWKPNQAEYERTKDETILENSFLKIKELIDLLNTNIDWRKEVTDVRNWLRFTAKEHYNEDEKKILRVYENTGKLSSGEQAQITYTIMGAAIAYQYGILKDGMNTNSFRFICVDEAFAKQDEDMSAYLMDLVKKLNLQAIIITPDDKIQIAEPYISAVHIVHRVNNRNSKIFDTTIEQAKKIVDEKSLETSDYSS
jgi:uncharacterized protein YPO0396